MAVIPYVTYYRAKSRNFTSESVPMAGGGASAPRATWLIMQIDTQPWDPYDWIAVSRDYAFDQGSYLVDTDYESLKTKIVAYMGSHAMQPDQPLHADQNNEPWVLGKCNECTGSGRYSMAMTGAYDGVVVYPIGGGGGNDLAMAKDYVRDWVADKSPASPIDPPVDLKGYSKADLPAIAVPPGGIPVGPGGNKPPVPVVPPPPPPAPPVAPTTSSSSAPLLIAAGVIAGLYFMNRSK